jgi:hypothetical protein
MGRKKGKKGPGSIYFADPNIITAIIILDLNSLQSGRVGSLSITICDLSNFLSARVHRHFHIHQNLLQENEPFHNPNLHG